MANRSFSGALVLGAGLGASLMYLFDPVLGRRRRARMRDLGAHAHRVERDLLRKAGRDVAHRAHGLAERVRHSPTDDAPDAVVEARVRSLLGRVTAHPSAIDVEARAGRISLRGPILAHEATRVVRAIERVPGVRLVIDQLVRHDEPGDVPALQGPRRPSQVLRTRQTWTPAGQVGGMAGGAALVGLGFVRDGVVGALAMLAGGAIIVRAAINRPFVRILGLDGDRQTIDLQKTVTIDAPVEEVFALWNRFEDFPRFMQHVREVRIHGGTGRRSVWTVDGPAGAALTFEAEITRFEPRRVIAWKTVPNQAIDHHGMVTFEDIGGGRTRLHIRLCYRPPIGLVGHAIAKLLGWDPKHRMDDDLIRVKALLEEGRTRAHHERVNLDELDLH